MAELDRLDKLSRQELIARSHELGVERAERMTRVELMDEIHRLTLTGAEQAEARGLFGVARAMVANVMERGLNLPDAAALVRGAAHFGARVEPRAPVATVTLAEIYAAQGHPDRARRMIDKVLTDEPDHAEALRLRAELGPRAPLEVAGEGDVSLLAIGPDYELPATLETTGEEIRTGEPPAVQEIQAVSGGPQVASSGEPSGAALPREARQPRVNLAWDGTDLVVDWSLPSAEPREYCLAVVCFRHASGRPLRQEARFLLGQGEGAGSSGRTRCPGFNNASACVALGWLEDGDRFIPLLSGGTLRSPL